MRSCPRDLFSPIDDKTADGGVGLHRHFGIFNSTGSDDLKSQPVDGRDDLLNAQTFEVLGIERGSREQKGESLGEVHVRDQPRDAPQLMALGDAIVTVRPDAESQRVLRFSDLAPRRPIGLYRQRKRAEDKSYVFPAINAP